MTEKLRIKAWGLFKITKKQFFWFYGVIFISAMMALIWFYYKPIDTSQLPSGLKKSIYDNIIWVLWIYLIGGLWEAQFYWSKFTAAQLQIIKEQKVIIEQHKEEVEAQRDEIEAQNEFILIQKNNLEKEQIKIKQSIEYAKRIQKAILRNHILEELNFLNYFLFFRPRDIVSGDFYWTYKQKDKVYIAVSDCTGHGVPGAFLSMLGVAFLNDIVNLNTDFSAAEILFELREKMKHALHQENQSSERKEGMDIGLLIIEDAKKAQFSGALQELILIRNRELKVYNGDKMPIGLSLKKETSFTNHEIEIEVSDRIYLYTDGYIDQIGGSKHRKYMRRKFRNFLLEIYDTSVADQGLKLANEFDNYKKELSQVDDVSVLGLEIVA